MSSTDSASTYYAIQLHSKCSDDAAQFVVDRLTADWDQDGGGLQIWNQPPVPHASTGIENIASNEHVLKIAEIIEIKKRDKDGFIRPFAVEDADDFPDSGRVGPLTLSDVHRCILYAIHRVHLKPEETDLPGCIQKVTRGAPIVSTYQEFRLLSVFPVHDGESLDKLYKSWRRNILRSPVEDIRDYFGESVAFFFSFSQVYTNFLFIVAFLGVTEYIMESVIGINYIYSNLIFTFLNVTGIAVYLEVWKRKSNEHSFNWGTGGKLRHKPPRPEFRGELRLSPVSGREELYYPKSKTLHKILTVSFPVTLACLGLAFVLMLTSFAADEAVTAHLADPETGVPDYDSFYAKIVSNVPSVCYSLIIIIFNSLYLKLARRLTIWENHRTQEQHDAHVTIKLILFEFVNTFLALFYVGFYQQDIKALRSQLFTTLMVQQVVNQVQEVLLPFFMHRPASQRLIEKVSRKLGIKEQASSRNLKGIDVLDTDDPRVQPVLTDLHADHLDSLHDDFMEVWLQFGHVFLFMAVYPLAAAIALVNNVTELWADRYKLCRLSKKPRPLSVRDIGAWYTAFRLTGVISILTNCSLLAMELRDTQPDMSAAAWFGCWVAVEHVFLVLFFSMDKLLSDVPGHVKLQMDRNDYHLHHKTLKLKKD